MEFNSISLKTVCVLSFCPPGKFGIRWLHDHDHMMISIRKSDTINNDKSSSRSLPALMTSKPDVDIKVSKSVRLNKYY